VDDFLDYVVEAFDEVIEPLIVAQVLKRDPAARSLHRSILFQQAEASVAVFLG